MKRAVVFLVFFCAAGSLAFAQKNRSEESRIYVGARLGGTLLFIVPSESSGLPFLPFGAAFFVSFEAALQIDFKLFDFLGLETGLMYLKNSIHYEDVFSLDMNVLRVPVLAKYTYRPDDFSPAALSWFMGVYFGIPLGKSKAEGNLTSLGYNHIASMENEFETSHGFMFGGAVEIKLGPGKIFIDVRYSLDFEDTRIDFGQGAESLFRGNRMHISLGYGIGIIRK